MLWPLDVMTFLAGGGSPNFHIATVLTPIKRDTGLPETVGYWTGMEDVAVDLGGTSRTLFGTKGALGAENPTYRPGTTIMSQSVYINGLSDQGVAVIQAYEVRFRPAELWQLCFSEGGEFKGARRLFKGTVDGADLQIGRKGSGSKITLKLASSARQGTQTNVLKKSNASYVERDGDTAMEYASMSDVDSDWWGPRG